MIITSVKEWFIFARDKNFSFFIMLVIMVVMPLHNPYLPPLMILLLLSWINDNYFKFNELYRSRDKFKILFLLFLLFFIWQSVSLLYSANLKVGLQNLGSRLSMLLFPLILFSMDGKIKSGLKVLMRVFAVSTSLYLVICFIYAIIRSVSLQNGQVLFYPHPPETEWENYFYNNLLTFSEHPSYMAMYAILAFLISFESANDRLLSSVRRVSWIVSGSFLIVSLYFISSRSALISLIIIIPTYVICNLIKYRKSKIAWVVLFGLMLLSIPFILKNERFGNLVTILKGKNSSELRIQDERIIIWKSAFKVINENLLFGAGIGDTREELVKEYNRSGAEKQSSNHMNAHNQFLQVSVESGIIGLLLFLSIIGFMAYTAITGKNLLYGLFIVMIVIFFMFESVLYRFAGISFFSLFSFLLLDLNNNNEIPRWRSG